MQLHRRQRLWGPARKPVRLVGALLAAAALLGVLAIGAALPAPWVERVYARGVYPHLARLIMPVSSALPVSLALLLAALLPLGWLAGLIRLLRAGRGVAALSLTLYVALALSAWFLLAWGGNYRRVSLETQLGLTWSETAVLDEAALDGVLGRFLGVIEAEHRAAPDEAAAWAALRVGMAEVVAGVTGVAQPLPERLKTTPPGLLIRWGGASGLMVPWTLEPHVDGALGSLGRVAVGAHELAHAAGFAGEADAELLAVMAGLRAPDAFARYAVSLRAFWTVAASLPPDAQQGWLARLPPEASADLREMYAPFARYRAGALLAGVQRRSYDAYLRSQGVSAGVGDYARAALLLAAAHARGVLDEALE